MDEKLKCLCKLLREIDEIDELRDEIWRELREAGHRLPRCGRVPVVESLNLRQDAE